jgi:peroxiredoxin
MWGLGSPDTTGARGTQDSGSGIPIFTEERNLSNEHEKQKFGEPLGDFSLRDLKGNTVTLSQTLEGKKAGVVVFWSSVCSHCVRYGEYLSSFEERHPDIPLIALASRHGETLADITKVVAAQKLRFRILHDAGGKIAKDWYTQQTPRAFLMDPRRSLIYRGAIDNFKYKEDPQYVSYLEPAMEQFLKGEEIAKPETASFGCAIQSVYYILPRAL